MTDVVSELVGPIAAGSFPDSPDVLSTSIEADAIPRLLDAITRTRNELSSDIRDVSKPYSAGVDAWIAQAKKVQQEIAKCKEDAQEIINQYTRLEQSRTDAAEHRSKQQLLSNEINFTQGLQEQLRQVASAHDQLLAIEGQITEGRIAQAAAPLDSVQQVISRIIGVRAKSVITSYRDDLLSRTRRALHETLVARFAVQHDGNQQLLIIEDSDQPTNAAISTALWELDSLETTTEAIAEILETFLASILSNRSGKQLISQNVQSRILTVSLGDQRPPTKQLLRFSRDVVDFLQENLPGQLYESIASRIGPSLISSLVSDWLTPAIPTDLNDLTVLDDLGSDVAALAIALRERKWPRCEDLVQWTQHAPRMWIAKRKSEALDSVRKAFVSAHGTLHQVERVERQKPSNLEREPQPPVPEDTDEKDDWNTSWGDEESADPSANEGSMKQEESSGWGFDGEDLGSSAPDAAQKANGGRGKIVDDEEEEEDAGDAWGWGDEDADDSSTRSPKGADDASKVINGNSSDPAVSQELTLTELYSITDIPDRLVEGIGKDIQDAVTLQAEDHPSLKAVPASSGLLALPSLSLAMFRATAPTYYAKTSTLGNMNLYNDALYLADKLRNTPTPPGLKDLESDCLAMEKFARSAYAREMDIQRTILSDLLDGTQGFSIPYQEQIEEAILATCDRLRQVHREWSPILSTSALLQSTGALFSSVLSKVITDVEEMDDISEAQSQRLSTFCTQLSKLEDLFVAEPPDGRQEEQEAVSMVAVYTSNWLRFQYLDQLLSASLVDIKYLWAEGELSLEFSADEVVDLIKALFAESSHRRSAISAIRGHRTSGMS